MFIFSYTGDRQWGVQKHASIWYHELYIACHRENRNMSQDKEREKKTVMCTDCGHTVPDGKEICLYCGAAQGEEDVNAESKMGMTGGDISWSFSMDKSRRPIHLSPVIQALIFIVSAAVGGFLVFLMG